MLSPVSYGTCCTNKFSFPEPALNFAIFIFPPISESRSPERELCAELKSSLKLSLGGDRAWVFVGSCVNLGQRRVKYGQHKSDRLRARPLLGKKNFYIPMKMHFVSDQFRLKRRNLNRLVKVWIWKLCSRPLFWRVWGRGCFVTRLMYSTYYSR